MKKMLLQAILGFMSVLMLALMRPASVDAQTLSFTGTMVSDTSLTIDSNRCADGPQYSYAAFSLTNNGSAIGGAYVDFQTSPSTAIALGGGQASRQYVGNWAAGQTKTFFWYLSYGCTSGVTTTIQPKITSSTGATTTVTTFRPITTRKMLSSNGGGQLSSGSVGPGAIIGQVITSDIVYIFGGVSAGDTYHMQPAGTSALNAQCFQLIGSEITASNIPALTVGTKNVLFFTASANQGGSGFTATVRWSFKYKCAGTGSTLQPYTNQLSGQQLKYSGNWSSFIGPTFPAASNPLTVTKTASPAVLPSGGAVTYTVTIKNPGSWATRIDSIADALPAGVSFAAISASSQVTVANSSSTPSSGATGTIKFMNIADSTYSIAAGDSLKLIYTATVTSTPGTYTNTATPYIADVAIGTSSASVSVGVPDYSITKTHTGNFTVGTNASYTITVKNTGTGGGANVVVTDTLPAGLAFVSGTGTRGSWTFASNGQIVTASLASGPLVSDSAKFTLMVLPAVAAVGTITNRAYVAGSYESNTTNNSASDAATVINNAPDLTVTKSATNTFVQAGNANYTMTVRNVGTATTANIVVVDTLPAGLTYSSATGTGWTFAQNGQVVTATYAGAALATNDSTRFSLVAAIGSTAYPSVINRAWVSGGGDTNTANDGSGNVTTSVTGISDPKVTKTSPASFTPGVNSTYTIKVDNVGTIATSGNIIVTDTLPAGISYVSLSGSGWASTANGTVSGRQWRQFTYSGAALAASSGTTTLTLNVSIAAAGATSITNRAWVSGGGNVITSNDSSSVTTTINGSDLTILKTAGTLTYGSSGTYTLTVTNAGTAATSGTITVTDTLPSGATWVSGSGTNWTVSHANGVVTATRSAAISASGTASFTITVNITSTADSISNKAYVTGGGQLVTTNDTSRITKAIVFPTPNLTILKSISSGASGGTIKPGEDMTYNIHFQNTGAGGAVSVVVTDVMPAQVYFKLNSVTSTITGGITATLQYFDGNAWVSSLTDGGCSAPSGYNGCVQKIRWSLGSTLPASAVGDIFFVVRVK